MAPVNSAPIICNCALFPNALMNVTQIDESEYQLLDVDNFKYLDEVSMPTVFLLLGNSGLLMHVTPSKPILAKETIDYKICGLQLPRKPHWSTRLLQLTDRWQHDGIM